MRILVDPETGEPVEVAEGDVLGLQPYDFAEAKRAAYSVEMYYYKLVNQFRDAKNAEAAAERDYRRLLATRIIEKREVERVPATLAETLAKGDEDVAEAKAETIRASGEVTAVWHLLELAKAMFVTVSQMTKWSERVDSSTYPEKPVY